jgi:hypothetical protein
MRRMLEACITRTGQSLSFSAATTQIRGTNSKSNRQEVE